MPRSLCVGKIPLFNMVLDRNIQSLCSVFFSLNIFFLEFVFPVVRVMKLKWWKVRKAYSIVSQNGS